MKLLIRLRNFCSSVKTGGIGENENCITHYERIIDKSDNQNLKYDHKSDT